jgi:hypothetical protein
VTLRDSIISFLPGRFWDEDDHDWKENKRSNKNRSRPSNCHPTSEEGGEMKNANEIYSSLVSIPSFPSFFFWFFLFFLTERKDHV